MSHHQTRMPRLSAKERRRRRRLERNRDYHLWKASLLREFIEKNGWSELRKDVIVPPGERLFSWVRNRRQDYKSGRIPTWLVQECESIPGWSWDPRRDRAKRNIDDLRAFVERHGWSELTRRPDGKRLSEWCVTRRCWYHQERLQPWIIGALEAIPGWSWDPLTDIYETHLAAVKDYVRDHGTADMPQTTPLGHWLNHVRELYRADTLPTWLIDELEALPDWYWEPLRAKQQRKLRALREFIEAHGWDQLRSTTVIDGVFVGKWSYRRRRQYRAGELEPWLRRALERVAGWRRWTR